MSNRVHQGITFAHQQHVTRSNQQQSFNHLQAMSNLGSKNFESQQQGRANQTQLRSRISSGGCPHFTSSHSRSYTISNYNDPFYDDLDSITAISFLIGTSTAVSSLFTICVVAKSSRAVDPVLKKVKRVMFGFVSSLYLIAFLSKMAKLGIKRALKATPPKK